MSNPATTTTTDDLTTTTYLTPRYDWYQTDQYVVVNVLLKNMSSNGVVIDYKSNALEFRYEPPPLSSLGDDQQQQQQQLNQKYQLSLNLFGTIVPSGCTYRLSAVKAEIKLRKDSGYAWKTLVKEQTASDRQTSSTTAAGTAENPLLPPPPPMNTVESATVGAKSVLSYEEKMRKLAKQIEQVEAEEEKNSGVEDLFRRIYANSAENVRRAMNKSFVESNGTVLSTNWEEVGGKKVEMRPPDSSEWKEFEK